MLTKNKDLLDRAMRAEAEVKRLRNLPRADVAAYDRRIQEMAARIKELEAEVEAKNKQIKELQDLIDKPPEEADWVADYHLLQSALDGPIIDAARKWHAAYRKAQNSNLMRAKEVERLRSVYLAYSRKHDENMLKVIARNKEQRARIKELESEITAWIADRDSWIARYEAVREEASREMAELMAREALERIRNGE